MSIIEAGRSSGEDDTQEHIRQLENRLGKKDKELKRCQENERSLRESEEKYRFLVENSKDIMWTIDTTGRWLFMTKNVERVTGYKVSDIIGKTVWDFVIPKYHPILKEKLRERQAGEELPPYEVEIYTKDGHIAPFEVFTTPIMDKKGQVVAILGVSRDISFRKKAEEKLKVYYDELERRVEERTADLDKARNTLQAILDTAPIGIVVADAETEKISYFTKRSIEMLGGMFKGKVTSPRNGSYQLFFPDGSPFPPDQLPIVRSLRFGERIFNVETLVRRSDGSEVIILYSSAPVMDATGRVTAAVATLSDITELKRTEAALRDEKDQAELYLDLMGHDINNLNHLAMGYLEMAIDLLKANHMIGEDSEALLTKPLQTIKNSSALIDNVRKIKRIREEELKLEEIDVTEMLDELAHEYAHIPGREVTISYEHPAHVTVLANRLLKDVFSNLIGNAIKHSTGPLEINLRLDTIDENGKKYCRVRIEDNGPGIPDRMKSQLLLRSKRGGEGLGLYLVRIFVKKFKGKIRIEDRVPGDYAKGARFVVMLPIYLKWPVKPLLY